MPTNPELCPEKPRRTGIPCGLNEYRSPLKGVHGHTFPNHHGKRVFRSTSMQQQSSSANFSMPLQPRGKRHGRLLPPRCPDSASLRMTEPKDPDDDPDAAGWRWQHSRYCVPDRLRGHCHVKQQGRIHTFTPVGSTPATAHQIRCHRRDNRHIHAAMSCRPVPEGWEWWAFSYIKILQVPCVAVSCAGSCTSSLAMYFSGCQTRKWSNPPPAVRSSGYRCHPRFYLSSASCSRTGKV